MSRHAGRVARPREFVCILTFELAPGLPAAAPARADIADVTGGPESRPALAPPRSMTNRRGICKYVTITSPTAQEIEDLIFASKICKNTKSNTIVFAKNGTLISSGTGQTSRVDALTQAIEKANAFGFDLKGAVMASDAFFPFPDCVAIAKKAGISAVIQPGGSIKDELSINYCNENKVAMVFTGTRHFKH